MFRNFFSHLCCSDDKIEVDLQIDLVRINDESLLNEAQRDFDLHSFNLEDKNEVLYLNETYLYQFRIYIEMNKGVIQGQNDFLYIIPEKAPLPTLFSKINRNYHIPMLQKQSSNEVGFAEFSLKNLSLNEPYIIYYMRRVDATLEIRSIFSSKIFKLIYKPNNAFVSQIRNMELCLVYEDDPDFFKQNVEGTTKIVSAWNTPHRKINSIRSCYSNSQIKNENENNNNFSNEFSTLKKASPHNFLQTSRDSNSVAEFKFNEDKETKVHQRNFSIFTASKSTCSSSGTGESYLGGLLENKLCKSKNLLKKNLFDNKTPGGHHKTLSMNTPNIKRFSIEGQSIPLEKMDKMQNHHIPKGSSYDKQLFSYKAMKNNYKGSTRTLLSFDENQLRPKCMQQNQRPNVERSRNSALKSYFQSHINATTELRKESPDQSFFLNVNEMSFTEIHPNKKLEKFNKMANDIGRNLTSQPRSSIKFITLPIDNKKNENNEGRSNFQTPQSKKRLYTVEEVFSISNDSSSLNDTHCFKFSNTNSAKKNGITSVCLKNNKEEKLKNMASVDVVEEDEEISLNHITANEISSNEEKLLYEKAVFLEENEKLPFFLKTLENKLQMVKILEAFGRKFKDIGFHFKLDFKSNVMVIYHEKSWEIYQMYKFLEFKNINDINAFLEDIHASVKFALL